MEKIHKNIRLQILIGIALALSLYSLVRCLFYLSLYIAGEKQRHFDSFTADILLLTPDQANIFWTVVTFGFNLIVMKMALKNLDSDK